MQLTWMLMSTGHTDPRERKDGDKKARVKIQNGRGVPTSSLIVSIKTR